MTKQSIGAHVILDLLAVRHKDDLFVPECKDGPTWTQHHFRMDAWAMRRSWKNQCATGYEIKVSRADFTGDQKWPAYLACCNEFYFACPAGLIAPEELSKDVGLLWATPAGGRLYLKRKAVYRAVKIPDEVYRYVLMSRVAVKRYSWHDSDDNRAYWKRWQAQEKVDSLLGRAVSNKLQKLVRERITEVEKKQNELERRLESYENIRNVLKSLGFAGDKYVNSYDVRRKLEKLKEAVPEDLRHATDDLLSTLKRFRDKLTELEKKESEADA